MQHIHGIAQLHRIRQRGSRMPELGIKIKLGIVRQNGQEGGAAIASPPLAAAGHRMSGQSSATTTRRKIQGTPYTFPTGF